MDDRREFLKKAGLLAGGIGLWNQLPASLQRALSINPEAGSSFYDAEHVVLLMQENRSFDHCFGSLQGVRGFNDPRAIMLPNENPVWLQTNGQGQTYAPFRLNIKDTKATWMGNLPHSWENQVDARNDGKYDKWLDAKQPGNKKYKDMPLTMGYYMREDIPFYYSMADAFTVCDQHFCASLTGTTTNRTFFWSGKIREKAGDVAGVRNADLYYNKEASWKTFPERLEELGIAWKVYQNEISLQTELAGEDEGWLSNFTDNNLEWFSQYNVRFSKAHYRFLLKRIKELPSEITALKVASAKAPKNLSQKINKKLRQKEQQSKKYLEEIEIWSPENFDKLTEAEKSLHRKAFATNSGDPYYHQTELFETNGKGETNNIRLPKGDILHQFREDVNTGKLPAVSWLVAPQNFSDHPSAPWYGAWYVSEVLDILTKNPEVWKKTIFIVTYDENDGYFDHVPPFVAPKPNDLESGKVSDGIDTSDEYVTLEEELNRKDLKKGDARESPVGLGYRVPMIIASPWSRGGWVNSQVCDHTSVLQFLEKFLSKKTGKIIKESNMSEWRRLVCGDLTSSFRQYNGEDIKLPGFLQRDPFVKKILSARFKKLPDDYKALSKSDIEKIKSNAANSLLPKQEPGIRDSCALPYQLYADGKLSEDKNVFEITFQAANSVFGNAAAGSPFNVYATGKYMRKNERNIKAFEQEKPRSYAVSAGSVLNDHWALQNFAENIYDLKVYGPNGFFREYTGNKSDPEISITCDYEKMHGYKNKLTGNIIFTLKNNSSNESYTILIADSTYKKDIQSVLLKPSESFDMTIDLKNNFNWYDVVIKVKDNNVFENKYAGRVETGNHSKTDPFMGRAVIE